MKRTIKLTLAFVLITVLFVWTVPMKSWACHINVDGWMSDTEGCPIPNNTFNLVVKKNGIITSTNPGGFFYNIEVSTLDWALNSLTISALIPPEFNLHSGKPVKVFLNGTQIYNGSDVSHTLTAIPANSVVTMRVHLKYGLIRSPISPPYPKTYIFDAAFSLDPAYYGVMGTAQATLTAVLR
ncbi:MAG: hypothetical protein KAX39_06015 [candidate division Zixibacteria bacterium]|nr:hypothetical protein [candidate division Zixibacteria bacterium]